MTQPEPLAHSCSTSHRSHAAVVKCQYPHALHLHGSGKYALISTCGGDVTFSLHADLESARRGLVDISRFGCGGRCVGRARHDIHTIELA